MVRIGSGFDWPSIHFEQSGIEKANGTSPEASCQLIASLETVWWIEETRCFRDWQSGPLKLKFQVDVWVPKLAARCKRVTTRLPGADRIQAMNPWRSNQKSGDYAIHQGYIPWLLLCIIWLWFKTNGTILG